MGPALEYEVGVKRHKLAFYQLILKEKSSNVSFKKKCHFSEDFRVKVKCEAKSLLEWRICQTKARLPGTRVPKIIRNDPTSHVSNLTLTCS